MTDTQLPVGSFREAAPLLRRPFEPAAVRWKVQTTHGSSGLIVGYIDARLATERLNLVCPHLWSDDYTSAGDGLLMCLLTVDGITRRDVGQGKGKALFSDAFKRAAVKFGVGVSLYALEETWLRVDDGHLRAAGQGKEKLFLQPAGIEHLRSLYAIWLGTAQGASFGEPLSHGDAAEGSVGDPLDPDAEHELDEAAQPRELPEAPPAKEAPDRAVPRITEGQAKLVEIRAAQAGMAAHELLDLCVRHGAGSAGGLTPDGFRTVLAEIEARADVQESVAP